jgi:SAM-dependent methyltransferase
MQLDQKRLASAFKWLKGTPFHPQWLVYRIESEAFGLIGSLADGRALDIGCSDQRVRTYLGRCSDYAGLDYYSTAVNWYRTRPAVYGDAHSLPFGAAEFDSVMLLDVLEHLAEPSTCIKESCRILKPGGRLFLKVPFFYPLHDAPRDFTRWTEFGLDHMVEAEGFQVERKICFGHPLETAALMANIACSRSAINWAQARNPLVILALLLPISVPLLNILSYALARISARDNLMPYAYLWILRRVQ